jgi:hypothetical protein
MLLQADPTVQYALGHHVGRVLYKDLAVESPYNTYKYKGLPPGPVASPGAASLKAAANPANVPYLYFVATPDGHHEFRMTLEQHTNAVKQVRAAMPKKPAPRMLAMASPGSAARGNTTSSARNSSGTGSKTPAKTVSKSTSASSKSTAKPSGSTVAKSTKSTTTKKPTGRTTTTKKRSTRTTTTSR